MTDSNHGNGTYWSQPLKVRVLRAERSSVKNTDIQ